MASALNTKINSYALERGIEFDEAYSLTPTRTGTNSLGIWALQNSPAPTYEPTVGPPGGSGSWRFNCPNTGSARFNSTAASELAGIDDEDWTQGFWFKPSAIPTMSVEGPQTNGITLFALTPSSTSAGWAAAIVPPNSTATASGGSISLAGRVVYGFTTQQATYSPIIQADTWYYIAARRIGTTMQGYFNGQLVGTENNSALTATPSRISFSATSHSAQNNPQIWISNYHQAPSSVLGPTQIAEIYQVGSTFPSTRTVKYFNGTSWVDSSAQKIYNGTSWVDWNAKRYDGTNWVVV